MKKIIRYLMYGVFGIVCLPIIVLCAPSAVVAKIYAWSTDDDPEPIILIGLMVGFLMGTLFLFALFAEKMGI